MASTRASQDRRCCWGRVSARGALSIGGAMLMVFVAQRTLSSVYYKQKPRAFRLQEAYDVAPAVTLTNGISQNDSTLGGLLNKETKVRRVTQTMSAEDDAILQYYLDFATDYFEFGTGYSTVAATNRTNVRRVHGVDAELPWLAAVMEEVKPANRDKLKFYFVDINGNHARYNRPQDESKRHNFPAYSLQLAHQQDMVPDTILVDGRFRVACAAQAALFANASTIIVIDDYMDRLEYHVVDAFLDRILGGEEIAVFRRRMDVSEDVILQIYEEYKYIAE